ncbi:methyltransferase domain-containing protein [Luteimonas sp. SDU101]|uniref:methyltransferase domain-containing protein n=1 Tax=unclassified Luteimonas TaxID=2629088 RepID=UPI003EBA0656
MRQEHHLETLRYTALEKVTLPRPVDRLEFIADKVQGKAVFDLGALDETALDAKRQDGSWLHARLCARARSVVGIDNSLRLPAGGMDTHNGGRIIHADIFDLGPVVERHGKPDVIVAGELIEHLPDTSGFLASLKGNAGLRGAEFVFSTPNACCWHNAIVGLAGRESMHQDHLQIYSYKTLRTLFARADIELRELVPYHVRFTEMINSTSGLRQAGVRGFQRVVNTLESITPILSAGWIGVARL